MVIFKTDDNIQIKISQQIDLQFERNFSRLWKAKKKNKIMQTVFSN